MSLKLKCPGCGQSVKVTLALAGKKGKCPGCSQSIRIPELEKLQALQAKLSAVQQPVPTPVEPAAAPKVQDDPFADLSSESWSDEDFDQPATTNEQSENPYASPLSDSESHSGTPDSGAEQTRKRLLSHEASIRSVGLLYLLGAVLGGLVGLAQLVMAVLVLASGEPAAAATAGAVFAVSVVLVGIAGFQYWVGKGLRTCNPAVRIPAIVVSAIGLLGFPIGTLISAYFLYLFASKKGAEVLSADYQRVIAATPHIKYRTSIIVWVFVGLLLVVMLLGLSALVASGGRP